MAGSRAGKGTYESKITGDRKEGSATDNIWNNLNSKIHKFYNGLKHFIKNAGVQTDHK